MSWLFLIILLGLYTFACCVLIFVILIQSGKGGGLSSLGSASSGLTEALGATGAEKTLNRLTTWCAAGFMVLAVIISLYATHMLPQGGEQPILGNPTQSTQGAPQAPLAGNPGQPAPAGQPATPGAAVPAAPGAAPSAPAPAATQQAPAPAAQAPAPAATQQAPATPAAPAPAK